jgi:hypothetical protein
MCAVLISAICSSMADRWLGSKWRFWSKPFLIDRNAPVITGTIFVLTFHFLLTLISRSFYILSFPVSFVLTFESSGMCISISRRVFWALSSPLCKVFTIIYLKQTMFLGYIVLQLFWIYNLWVWRSVDRASWYICVIRTNKMHFFLFIYFSNHPVHVSNRLTVHRQEVFYCICSIWYLSLIVLAASQRRCMINTVYCIYSNCLLMMNS